MKYIMILLFLIMVGAAVAYLTKEEFPAPNGGKALLRDELIILSEP